MACENNPQSVDFYASRPSFGRKYKSQLDELRWNSEALAPIVKAAAYDLDSPLKNSSLQGWHLGETDFFNKFRLLWNKCDTSILFQFNKGTSAVPSWETAASVDFDSGQFYFTTGGVGGSGNVTFTTTTGTPSISSGTLILHRDDFYLTKDSSGFPIVNSAGGAGGTGPQGPQGIQGPQGDQGPPGEGFYLTIKQTDDAASFSNIEIINFNTNSFYITQNSPNTDEVIVNFRGVVDHGNLTGLTDDDHTQYSLVDGTRAYTGDVTINNSAAFLTINASSGNAGITINADPAATSGFNLGKTGEGTKWNIRASESDVLQVRDEEDSGNVPFQVFQNAGDDLLALKDGKVGINTESPGQALDVVGDARVSGETTSKGKLTLQGGIQGFYLGMAEDVSTGGALDNQVLTFDDSDGVWKPASSVTSEFYLTVKQTDDEASFTGINVVAFNAEDFYVTQNSPNTDEVIVNFRGTTSSTPGITSVTFATTTEDPFAETDKLVFNRDNFYLTKDSDGDPIVNFTGGGAQGPAGPAGDNVVDVTTTTGDPVIESDTIIFNRNHFYIVEDTSGNAIINLDQDLEWLPRNGSLPMTGTLQLVDGSVSLPGISFDSNETTGIFTTDSDDRLSISIGGSEALRFRDSSGQFSSYGRIAAGSVVNADSTGASVNSAITALGPSTIDVSTSGLSNLIPLLSGFISLIGGGTNSNLQIKAFGTNALFIPTESVTLTASGGAFIGNDSSMVFSDALSRITATTIAGVKGSAVLSNSTVTNAYGVWGIQPSGTGITNSYAIYSQGDFCATGKGFFDDTVKIDNDLFIKDDLTVFGDSEFYNDFFVHGDIIVFDGEAAFGGGLSVQEFLFVNGPAEVAGLFTAFSFRIIDESATITTTINDGIFSHYGNFYLAGNGYIQGPLEIDGPTSIQGKLTLQGGIQGFYLGMAEDVSTGGASDNQVLTFDGSDGVWKPDSATITFKDSVDTYTNSELNFNTSDFYLSTNDNAPVVNLNNNRRVLVILNNDTTQSIADSSNTEAIEWDRAVYDYGGWWDGNTKLIVPNGVSKIRIIAHINFESENLGTQLGTGWRELFVEKNGAGFDGRPFHRAIPIGFNDVDHMIGDSSPVIDVAPGDEFVLYALQTSGGALDISGNFSSTWFAIEEVKP